MSNEHLAARAIADMLLARADGSSERFYSMSSQIESERSRYYQCLEEQQRGDVDLTPWLQWFLGCLDRSFDRAAKSLEHVVYKGRMYHARMAKCSTDTALRDIRELLDHGIFIRNPGGGRSTSYRLAADGELELSAGQPACSMPLRPHDFPSG